jgi:hypothetical protein
VGATEDGEVVGESGLVGDAASTVSSAAHRADRAAVVRDLAGGGSMVCFRFVAGVAGGGVGGDDGVGDGGGDGVVGGDARMRMTNRGVIAVRHWSMTSRFIGSL